MMNSNGSLHQYLRMELALATGVPAGAAPKWLHAGSAPRITIMLIVENATGVVGSDITLLQARDDAGTDEKPVEFDRVYASIDGGLSFTRQLVDLNTFTTDATDNVEAVYNIEIEGSFLDTNDKFTHVRVGVGDATAATVTALYVLWPR